MQTVRIPRPPSAPHHMNPQQAYGHPQQQQPPQQQQQQHAPQPSHPSQQYYHAAPPTPSGPSQQQQQQPSYASYTQQQQPPPGQEYDEQSMRRSASMAGQRDPATLQQQQQQQQQHYQQQQQMMRTQRPPPPSNPNGGGHPGPGGNGGGGGPPQQAGYTSTVPSHPTQQHPSHGGQQPMPQPAHQQQTHTPQPPAGVRPQLQRSASSNMHIQMPSGSFMAQGASQSSMATAGISPVALNPGQQQGQPQQQQGQTPQTHQMGPGPSRSGEGQFAQQQQQPPQTQPPLTTQAHQRPQFGPPAVSGASPQGAPPSAPGQGPPSFASHLRQGSLVDEPRSASLGSAQTASGSGPKGKGRARAVADLSASKEDEEKHFVELVYEFLYKARLFSTARALLAETTLDPSSSSSVGESHLANGALPSPGSVHSSPRELLVMGESPRPTEDDPTGAVAAAKRKRSNGSESDRGDDKDDSKNGQQLPSPVSGTDTEAGKDGDKKDETKDEAGGAEAKDKGSVGGGGTRGRDYAKARKEAVDRPELRRPDVDGGERSERGLLHEWWTIFSDFRQIQTSATLAANPPLSDAEMYLSSFGQQPINGPLHGSIARVGVGRTGSLAGGRPHPGARNGSDGESLQQQSQQPLGNGMPGGPQLVRYASQPGRPPQSQVLHYGQPGGPEQSGPYGARQGGPPGNPAVVAQHRNLIQRIEEMGAQLNIAPDRIAHYIRSPLPQLASIAEGLATQLNVRHDNGEPSPKRVKMDGTPVPPPGGAVPKLSLQQQQQLALRQVQQGNRGPMQMHPSQQAGYTDDYHEGQKAYAAMMHRRTSQQMPQNGQSPTGGPQMLPPAPPGYVASPVGQPPHPSQYDMSRPASQMSYHSAYTPQAGGPPPMMGHSGSEYGGHAEYAATPSMGQAGFDAASPSTTKVPGKAAGKLKAKAAPKKAKAKSKAPASPLPPSPAQNAQASSSNHASPQVFPTASTPANTTSPHPAVQPSPAGLGGSPLPPTATTPQGQYAQDPSTMGQIHPQQMHDPMPQDQQPSDGQQAPPPQQLMQQDPNQGDNSSLADPNLFDPNVFAQAGEGGDYQFSSMDMSDPGMMALFASNAGEHMLDLDAELGTDFDFSSWMVDETQQDPPA